MFTPMPINNRRKSRIATTCLALWAISLLAACQQRQTVDLIVHHATIYTVDSTFSTVEAMAVKDGKITATGTNEAILAKYQSSNSIDANGQPVYPGFVDAHAHFVGYGRNLYEVSLYDCVDWAEAVARVAAFAEQHPNEQWIRGRGWDQNKWPGMQYPDNRALDSLLPGKPVLLQRIDGHAAIANSKALEMAGITATTTLPGGEIRVINGRPTGLLIDNAVDLATRTIPQSARADYEKWLPTAEKNCTGQGLTTVADCGLTYREITYLDSLQQEGKLHLQVYALLSDDGTTWQQYQAARDLALKSNDPNAKKPYEGRNGPYKTNRLFVNGLKAYADGALGSRGACLLSHYTDKPGWGGFLLSSLPHFDSLAVQLLPTDFQLCTHAIGDSGNRAILQLYNRHLGTKNDRRWRIEHAQVVDPTDFHLFGQAAIIPSVQPTHATSDMYWAASRLGPQRIKGAYAYRQLLEQNGWLPLGTDFPVEDISPIKTFYAAVARKDAKGYPDTGFQKENALTRPQALRGITIWAAKACFLEKEIGSLEPGKNADFVLLDKDLMKAPEPQLLSTKVMGTWINGKKMK